MSPPYKHPLLFLIKLVYERKVYIHSRFFFFPRVFIHIFGLNNNTKVTFDYFTAFVSHAYFHLSDCLSLLVTTCLQLMTESFYQLLRYH